MNLTLVILGLKPQPSCGDFSLQEGEQCEPRLLNLNGRVCTNRCVWTACSDGIDNDGDGYADRADGGCYDSGNAPVAQVARAFLAQFFFDLRISDYRADRDSEECPDGMVNGQAGNCVPR